MVRARLLIVDQNVDRAQNCARLLGRSAHYLTATDPRRALELIETERVDLMLVDSNMPEIEGMGLLQHARAIEPGMPVIMMAPVATIASAVAAIKEGAFDYLPHNCPVEQLRLGVERALRHRRFHVENRNLRSQLQQALGLENIIGTSPAITRVFELVKKAARSEANTLVVGDSGTGKELIARAIHANSPRSAGAFIPIDCASFPEELLESELFGHERGSFTGAVRTKLGLMEMAHRGTLFLDEIGELPPALQVKLLRALQEHQIRRVGGTSSVHVDVRVVSATNRNLREAITKGHFREELYYRINVITIQLPPLHERAGDVKLLAHAFIRKYGLGRIAGIDESAMHALEQYAWPGNVRELQNAIERACALAEGEIITSRDLPDQVLAPATPKARVADVAGTRADALSPGAGFPLRKAKERWLQILEASYLRQLLDRHGGKVTTSAKVAGVDRKTFHRLINKYGLRRSSRSTSRSGSKT